MQQTAQVLEYKCPCCGAPLIFGQESQKMTCRSCGNEFDLDTVRQYAEAEALQDSQQFHWDQTTTSQWSQDDENLMVEFNCPSCGGVIQAQNTTAATFCPYCDNPAVLPSRLSGGVKPDAVIPFCTTQEDAKAAFLRLCKGKPLLPKGYCDQQRLEKITGMYVPFWLYSCGSRFAGSYKATRVHHWSDSDYNYTRTEHFMLQRSAGAAFYGIPMDGSRKMDDAIMESIEPFDYNQMVDFNTAYLSGFLADKYDVEAHMGQERVRQRVSQTMDAMIADTMIGYTTVLPTARQLRVDHGQAKYVLLPVWMLTSRYQDKTYTFAMNGQTGKMTGTFPICPKKTAAWFAGIFVGVTALVTLIQLLVV